MINGIRLDIDETTGKYKVCPVCCKDLLWSLDYKKCNCKDINCCFNNKDNFKEFMCKLIKK